MQPEETPVPPAETQPQLGTVSPVAPAQGAGVVQSTALQRKHGVVCLILARLLDAALHPILEEPFYKSISEKIREHFTKTGEKKAFPYRAQTLQLETEQIMNCFNHVVFSRRNSHSTPIHLDVCSGHAKYASSAPPNSKFLNQQSTMADAHNAVDSLIGLKELHEEVDDFMCELYGVVEETNSLEREAKAWKFAKRWIPDDPGPCPNKYWHDPSPVQRSVKTLELYYNYWVQHDSDAKLQHYRAPQHLAFYSLVSLPTAEAAAASVCMLITLVPALLPSSTAKIHLIREPLMRSVGHDLELAANHIGVPWSRLVSHKLIHNTGGSTKVSVCRLKRRRGDHSLHGLGVPPGEAIKAAEVVAQAIERRECRLCFLDVQEKGLLVP